MNGHGHDAGAWRNAQTLRTCAHCGASLTAPGDQCLQCGRFQTTDDGLTVLGETPIPTPAPTGSSAGPAFGNASDDVTRFVASSNVSDDVTKVPPAEASDDVTRFAASAAGSSEDQTRFAAPPAGSSEDETRFVPADSSDDETRFATPDDALTVAAPATPPSHKVRPRRGSDSGPLEVGQSFGPRYHIIRMLGVGGMGAVYQAWDAELGVAVAIKVIRPEIMEDPVMGEEVSRRFKRELLLARQVTHKNVVRIHDIGDIDGIKYITMSYVEGTDLSTILKRDGKQPIANVLRIARAVISGLVAAHTAGVVHRDLKPANIMIGADGEALIMDFGIAHSTGDPAAPASGVGLVPEKLRRAAASQTAATTVGSVVGTVEYMAPEQARGQSIDQRADVYSFGLILYDILLGRRRASSGQSAVDELQRRMTSPPPPLQALDKEIPPLVAALVGRCVEPEADKRFATSAEVAAELDRLDDQGKLIPIARRLTKRMVAVVALLVGALVTGAVYVTRQATRPEEQHEPVKLIIADIANPTRNVAFTGTLEPIIRLALEEARFISAFDRTQMRALGLPPIKGSLGPDAARQIAFQQGLGVVVTGEVRAARGGFALDLRAAESVSGKVIAETSHTFDSADKVLPTLTRATTQLRDALGDDTSDTTRRFAADTLSATSIEVVRNYAAAMEAQADGRFEDALDAFQKTLDGDPDFGLAYAGMASSSRNLGRIQDAEKYAKEAARHVGRMTERERYRARGLVYMSTGEYDLCLKEFGELLKRYSADVVAHNNVAYCQTQLRRMPDAVTSLKSAVAILPKRALYRLNLALYLAYAGNFTDAETEGKATAELGNALGFQPLAYAQVGQERINDAKASYEALMKAGPQGAAIASSGLADVAVFEGRFADAVAIYERGVEADLQRKDGQDRAAAKLAGIAYAELQRGRKKEAIAAAKRALTTSQSIRPRLKAALALVDAGDIPSAQAVAKSLASESLAEPRASARIIEGAIARQKGDYGNAIAILEEADEKILDTWAGQFELGHAYLAAGRPTPADSAFDRCIRRSGELFLDEEPTYGLLPAVYYLQGRAREAAKTIGYADLYRHYLRIREKAGEDPTLKDVRARVAAQPGR